VGPEDPVFLNTFLDVPPAKARLIPWLAQAEQLKGWLYWYTNWGSRHAATSVDAATNLTVPIAQLDMYGKSVYSAVVDYNDIHNTTIPTNGRFSNSDGNLVYAGVDGPLSSQRSMVDLR
jgi:hypothetical protein